MLRAPQPTRLRGRFGSATTGTDAGSRSPAGRRARSGSRPRSRVPETNIIRTPSTTSTRRENSSSAACSSAAPSRPIASTPRTTSTTPLPATKRHRSAGPRLAATVEELRNITGLIIASSVSGRSHSRRPPMLVMAPSVRGATAGHGAGPRARSCF
ncbi:hypothetical protein SDC9_196689 [bioreactor metagenome]|uniref:Uncharacterized protein n=1 Tax=bioreactor metagenome TaxID=1076179 RepID=A0A645IDT3_9ZZZZ